MKVVQVSIANFRSISEKIDIPLGSMNVLVGANNSGKSTILRALYAMQAGLGDWGSDVRDGTAGWEVDITFDDIKAMPQWRGIGDGEMRLELRGAPDGQIQRTFLNPTTGNKTGVPELPPREPHHFIVPFLAKRKVNAFVQAISESSSMAVVPSMENLGAKLFRLSNRDFPGHEAFRTASLDVLGFAVGALPSPNGMRPGIYLPNRSRLWIDQMGEGVPNAVALLADLSLSEGKLFLIEEPENDLHPTALKGLLDLIVSSSASNQFVVSTHSNIVLRHLGVIKDARIYKIEADRTQWPIDAKIHAIPSTPESRLNILKELGYSLDDFELWNGWLILEEASAERIIRDYLIPWFVPRLSRLRTLSAGGVDSVEPTFHDFNRLIRYAHLEVAYRSNAWVFVDGDPVGQRVVERLRQSFAAWPADRFHFLNHANFEHYYPVEFADRTAQTLAVTDKVAKREEKRVLLLDVLCWLDENEARGKAALASSAAEVIARLKIIATEMH
jgi:AAA ATPase domain/AAA domain, putative AbiEii toxin, Type IV TA system